MTKSSFNYIKFIILIIVTLSLHKAFYKRLDINWYTEHTLSLIARLEGFYSNPYICPAGFFTIGFGHIVEEGENFLNAKLTSDEAFKMLETDLGRVNNILFYLETPELLRPHQLDALISLSYNLGVPEISRSFLIKSINQGDLEKAYDFFAPWKNINNKPSSGLAKRRLIELMVFADRSFDPNSHLLPSEQWGIPLKYTDENWMFLKSFDSHNKAESLLHEAVNVFYKYKDRKLGNLSNK